MCIYLPPYAFLCANLETEAEAFLDTRNLFVFQKNLGNQEKKYGHQPLTTCCLHGKLERQMSFVDPEKLRN